MQVLRSYCPGNLRSDLLREHPAQQVPNREALLRFCLDICALHFQAHRDKIEACWVTHHVAPNLEPRPVSSRREALIVLSVLSNKMEVKNIFHVHSKWIKSTNLNELW